MNRAVRCLALTAGLVAVSPAWGLRLGSAAADKEAAQPLRQIDLASALSGRGGAPAGWSEARAKLPSECRTPSALSAGDCSDTLRCNWLGARAAALDAWEGGTGESRAAAAEWLARAADRLAAGGVCGRELETRQRWAEDQHAAAHDAAVAYLALLAAPDAPRFEGPDVLSPAEGRRMEEAIRRARAGGLTALTSIDLESDRALYRSGWKRRVWLSRLPALAAVRALVARSWSGKAIPAGCGGELLRPDLLEDQWRGYLVREVVPAAVSCLAQRRTTSSRAGTTAAGSISPAQQQAQLLMAAARADRGGRDFGADPQMVEQIAQFAAALSGAATTATIGKGPAHAATRPTASEPPARSVALAATSPRRVVPQPTTAVPPAASLAGHTERLGMSSDSGIDPNELVRLAGRVGEWFGDGDRAYGAAKRAKTNQMRQQVLDSMLVALHRAVCAPLEGLDPRDLEAARQVLETHGLTANEATCRGAGDRIEDLRRLLDEAPRLLRVQAAATIRQAAGQAGVGRTTEAIETLERVPEPLRGTTWAVVAAWCYRKAGDPVAASRRLARVSPETLQRLRTTGGDDLARLVAHAWMPQ